MPSSLKENAFGTCDACSGRIVETCEHGSMVDRALRALADLTDAKQRAKARKQHRDLPDFSQEADEEAGEAYDIVGGKHRISGRTVRRLELVAEQSPTLLDDIRAGKTSIARAYLDVRNARNDHGSAADSDTYYTPRNVIDAIEALVGKIDLDPCTTLRNWVGARHFYSLQRGEDGLHLPWHVAWDRTAIRVVYVNSPYNDGAILQWVHRASKQSAEHGLRIVVLMPARMGSEYAQYALQHAQSIHFFRERLNFLGIDEKPTGAAPFDCMLVAFGCDLHGIGLPGVTR